MDIILFIFILNKEYRLILDYIIESQRIGTKLDIIIFNLFATNKYSEGIIDDRAIFDKIGFRNNRY